MRTNSELELNWLTGLIGINVVLFLIPTGLDLLVGGGYSSFLWLLGALQTSHVFVSGEIWRMVSTNFLHVDIIHLLFNMLALWSLGKIVFEYYGGKLLLVFYMVAGIAGSLFSAFFLHNTITVGASGAVFGLIGVLIGSTLRNNPGSMRMPFSLSDILPIAVYSLVFGFIPGTNINNIAHFAGLGAGIVMGYFIDHQITFGKHKQQKLLEKVMYWVSIGTLICTYLMVILSVLNTFDILPTWF